MELRGAEASPVVRLEEGLGVEPEQPRVARQVAAQEHRDREEVEPFRLQVLDEVAAEAHPFRDVRDRVPRRLARTAQVAPMFSGTASLSSSRSGTAIAG